MLPSFLQVLGGLALQAMLLLLFPRTLTLQTLHDCYHQSQALGAQLPRGDTQVLPLLYDGC